MRSAVIAAAGRALMPALRVCVASPAPRLSQHRGSVAAVRPAVAPPFASTTRFRASWFQSTAQVRASALPGQEGSLRQVLKQPLRVWEQTEAPRALPVPRLCPARGPARRPVQMPWSERWRPVPRRRWRSALAWLCPQKAAARDEKVSASLHHHRNARLRLRRCRRRRSVLRCRERTLCVVPDRESRRRYRSTARHDAAAGSPVPATPQGCRLPRMGHARDAAPTRGAAPQWHHADRRADLRVAIRVALSLRDCARCDARRTSGQSASNRRHRALTIARPHDEEPEAGEPRWLARASVSIPCRQGIMTASSSEGLK